MVGEGKDQTNISVVRSNTTQHMMRETKSERFSSPVLCICEVILGEMFMSKSYEFRICYISSLVTATSFRWFLYFAKEVYGGILE